MKRTTAKSIFGALCLFFAISLFSVFCSISFNTISVSAYSAAISTSDSVTLDATINGTGTSIKAEAINIQTDCRAGYNLNIATPNGSNLYLNGNNSENASFTAVDGTSALSSSNNTNKWGYTLATNPTSSTVFLPLSANTSVLKTPAQTASPNSNINDTFNINYGVHTDETITPGAYRMGNNGTIVYYLTMDETCMTVNIAYDGNNADAGTMGAAGTGIIHTGVKDGDTIDLIASNFSRTGYGFAGWSTDQNAGAKLIDNDNTNNPIVYGPQETVTLPNGFTNYDTDNDGIVKLYAVWIPSQGNLQGWMGCSSLDTTAYDSTTGVLDLTKKSVTALTDQRDNDTYAVARLADGQCWMIENLRLDNDAVHNSDGLLAQGYGKSATYGNFSGLADPELAWANNSTATNSLYYSGTQSGTATINIGTIDSAGYRFPRYNHDNTNSRASNPTTNNVAMYSYGNYYTWHAAMANTIYYSGPTATDTDGKTSETVNTSLCPTGWKLPYGRDIGNGALSGGFSYLDISLGGTGKAQTTVSSSLRWRKYPNNLLYSGKAATSTGYRGIEGYYWSSTIFNNLNAYIVYFGSSNINPGATYNAKYMGYTIRCVASEPETYTLTYDANGGSGEPSSPEPIYANGSATFTISSTTPTRAGYTFAGWTDEKGNETQPGASFTTKDLNAVLYAIWTNNSCNPTATTIATGNTSTDAVCLQDVTPSMKAALPIATATTGTYNLIDARDGKSYTVAKLADGNLWLTKNLNYGSNSDILLTSHDTDLPSDKTFKAPASTTAFETANSDAAYVSPKILTDSTYGGYYSYAAAIASTDAYSTSNQDITTSICPKGWDLPTSTIYNNLRTTSGNTTFAKMSAAPYSFIYAGYKNGTNTPTNQTSNIRLWTSTNYSASYAYYTTAYDTATYNYKRIGDSVRCVASNGTATINYNANGGTGTMASQSGDINALGTISSNSFTAPANRQFRNWNTKADGTGTTVAAGSSVSSIASNGDTITLYAQWDEIYTLTFINTALTSNNIRTKTVVVGQSATVAPSSSWSRTGYKLIGWDTVTNDGSGSAGTAAYTNGQSITPTSDMTFYTVWRPVYNIQYDGNGSDNDSTGMGSTNATTGIKTVNHTNVAEGDTFDLFASNFKRAGYGFVGWSTDSDAWNKLTDNDTTNDAKIWGPNEIITAPAPNGTPITTLYAIWAPAEKTDPSNPSSTPVYLQGWTGCSAMTATTYNTTTGKLTVAKNSITALTDERDGNVYTIAKLADENCWMVENLRLDNTPELSTTNTNIKSNNSTLPITNVYGGTTSNYLSATSNSWCTTSSAACDDQSRLNTTNTIANITPSQTQSITSANAHTHFNNTIHSYGNYYNWYSATVGYGTHSRSTSEPTAGDLCPAGWKLPYGGTGTSGTTDIGGTKGGFSYLDKQMGGTGAYQSTSVASNKWRMFPNNFVYSGSWGGSSAGLRGNSGNYWSASASNSSVAYYLYLYSTYVNPGNGSSGKYVGYAVRCVAGS